MPNNPEQSRREEKQAVIDLLVSEPWRIDRWVTGHSGSESVRWVYFLPSQIKYDDLPTIEVVFGNIASGATITFKDGHVIEMGFLELTQAEWLPIEAAMNEWSKKIKTNRRN